MFRIFYQDKDILFARNGNDYDPKEVILEDKNQFLTPEQLFFELDRRGRVVLVSDDPKTVYDQFLSQLHVHEAAGGLVVNGAGEALLICRNDRWDLPKGHREEWEDLEECALREVSEECGIHGMELGEQIGLTEHIYRLHGKWILKSTHWYNMRYTGNEPLVPQREEGIEAIEWVTFDEMRKRLEASYATLRYLVGLI